MTKYVAFLRAINVGGRVVTMSALRAAFEKMGLANVETFIASGNVIFDTRAADAAALERRIEQALLKTLGYEVSTFLRTPAEVSAVARQTAFDPAQVRAATALYVGFVAGPLSKSSRQTLAALETSHDRFHVSRREIYWLCDKGQGDSKISNAVIERALKLRSTFRNINTVTRLAERLAATPAKRS